MSSWSISVLLLWLMGCAQHARVPAKRSRSAGEGRPVASMPTATKSPTGDHPSLAAPVTKAPVLVAPAARRVDVAECNATLWLHDTPAYFEGAAVGQLHHLRVDVAASPNLLVTLDAPAFDAVRLPPRFALRLPHGPALDAPAGRTGLLYFLEDLPGVLVVGTLNLAMSPVLLPISIVLDSLHPDGAFIPLPKTPRSMFSVALLDEVHFNAEVQRRAEPHRAVLEQEQQRQQRFAEWLVTPQQSPQTRQCQTDAQGHCQLSLWWPKDAITFHLGPEGCRQPQTQPAPTDASAPATPQPVHRMVQLTPARLSAPSLLAVPPTNDTRGAGAQATAEAWARDNGVNWLDSEGKALFARAPRRGSLQTGDTLVCRIRVRGDMDGDGSPPEVMAHFVFGGITDFAERGFFAETGWQCFIVLPAIDLRAGDLVKLSVADADVFDDDWIGMDLVTWDGRLPLRFSHRHFDAECRGVRVTPAP